MVQKMEHDSDQTKPHIFLEPLEKDSEDTVNTRLSRLEQLLEPTTTEDNLAGFTSNLYKQMEGIQLETSQKRPMTASEKSSFATRLDGAIQLSNLALAVYKETRSTMKGVSKDSTRAEELHEQLRDVAMQHGFGEKSPKGYFRIIDVDTVNNGFKWALDAYVQLGESQGRPAPKELQDKEYRDSLARDMRKVLTSINTWY